jgi:predicted nucleotidyltransferase
MIQEWNKFKGWSVLEFFLLNPNTKIHINELARQLKTSPRTAQMSCNMYNKEGLLRRKEIGNIHQFFLNENDSRVRILKKFIGPYLVSDKWHLNPFLEKNKNILSVSIYGSFATGEYGDHSDLDILVITADEKKPDSSDLSKIELKLGREAAVTSIPHSKWRVMERKKDNFFLSIRKKSILIWGNPL